MQRFFSAASQNRDRTKRRRPLRPRLCSAPLRKGYALHCVRGKYPPHPKFNSLKKSLPLSSMMMKAGKSSTSMRQIASMP
jgi:hypothetical protein